MGPNWKKNITRYQNYFLYIRTFYNKRPDIKMFLEIFLSLGTIALFSLLALRPTLLTIAGLLTEIKEKKEILSQMDKKIRDLDTAQNVYQNNSNNISLLSIAVPSQPQPEKITRQVEGLAKKYNLGLTGMSVGETYLVGSKQSKKMDKTLTPLPSGAEGLEISVNVSGAYQGILEFLKALEKLRMPILTDATTIASVKSETVQNLILTVAGRSVYEK